MHHWDCRLHPLGSLSGSISFGGPVALPIVKGTTTPSDVLRVNSNTVRLSEVHVQRPATQLPLIVDLTYDLGDYNVDMPGSDIGVRPGGASIAVVMSVVDGGVVSMNQIRDVGILGFGNLECGAEPSLGWPAGSILGTATFSNPEHSDRPAGGDAPVTSCAIPATGRARRRPELRRRDLDADAFPRQGGAGLRALRGRSRTATSTRDIRCASRSIRRHRRRWSSAGRQHRAGVR
jgi:hypothetical protein